MIPNPIARVLSTFRRRRVRALLMGGQACILRGAAEFSRDVDWAVAVSHGNLERLRRALAELKAGPVFFPPLSRASLLRGHACHFRCQAPDLEGLRIDVMSVMRGVDGFGRLWRRREILNLPGTGPVPVLSLPDLVQAKKTQRDKDWPMVRRLVEADIAAREGKAALPRIRFWLKECRTPELLCELAASYPEEASRTARPAVRAARRGNLGAVERCLRREEDAERRKDRRYWAPLKAELEAWRLGRPRP